MKNNKHSLGKRNQTQTIVMKVVIGKRACEQPPSDKRPTSRFQNYISAHPWISNNTDNDDDDDNDNNNGITQMASPQSGSSSTWGTNDFTSLSKDSAAKEDHLNI